MKNICRTLIFSILVVTLTACNTFMATPAESPIPTVTSLPTSIPTPEPTITLTPQPTASWSGILTARMPTLREIDQNSIWVENLVDPKDLHVPGTDSYTGEVVKEKEYLFPAYWCAINPDVLRENMPAVSMQLVINAEIIPDEFIYSNNYDAKAGWHCYYRYVMLGGWKPGT